MSRRGILTAARGLTDPVVRGAYLDEACGADTGLRSRVEALLRAADRPNSLLDQQAIAAPDSGNRATRTIDHNSNVGTDEMSLGFLAPPTRPDSLGRLGHYEVLQELGRGGFGIVLPGLRRDASARGGPEDIGPQLASLLEKYTMPV